MHSCKYGVSLNDKTSPHKCIYSSTVHKHSFWELTFIFPFYASSTLFHFRRKYCSLSVVVTFQIESLMVIDLSRSNELKMLLTY